MQNGNRTEPGAASLGLAVTGPCVIFLRTNNSDFMKYIHVRLLGDFLIGATNPDHTSLEKDGISSEESMFSLSVSQEKGQCSGRK